MPRVEAALLRAAVAHETAAATHERAAELFTKLGKSDSATRERVRAGLDHEGAVADRERARLRRQHLETTRPPWGGVLKANARREDCHADGNATG